jgi:hypothetical protein
MSDTFITAVSSECNNNAPSYQVDKRQGGRAISVRFAHDNTRTPKLDFRGMKFKISYQNLATQNVLRRLPVFSATMRSLV